MRPCNQCRRPVENCDQLCQECREYNQEHGLASKPPVSVRPIDPTDQPPVPLDASINILAYGFTVTAIVLGALIGAAMKSVTVAVLGIIIGIFASLLFLWSIR